ncbi:MAG: hypothetical protein P8Y80_08405 [Acidobacteriota bacterium]|jgi:ABC-type transport system involved in multi-copper enzyme maturation permease subunit
MWTIIKKEWRENVLFIASAFVIVLFVLDYTAYVHYNWSLLGISSFLLSEQSLIYPSQYWQTPPTLETAWMPLCVIAAFLLGLRQIYTEDAHHTWALLVQLPMRREKILYAKFFAGLTLLAAIFLPAGLLIVLRLSTPGVWPGPVYLIGFLPLLLHLLAALVCYLIIFLTALAPLRWFGTRLLIPFAAMPGLLLAQVLIDRFRVYEAPTLGNFGLFLERAFSIPFQVFEEPVYGNNTHIWIFLGITLLVAVMGLWALRSVARTREY